MVGCHCRSAAEREVEPRELMAPDLLVELRPVDLVVPVTPDDTVSVRPS